MLFQYFDDEPLLNSDVFEFVVPNKLESSDAVFNAYGEGLAAPNNYFASNWDAFNDSLLDLSWIAKRNIIIVHHSLPKLNDADLKIYLEILSDACSDRANQKTDQLAEQFENFIPHRLTIMFPFGCRSKVVSLVS